MKKVVALAVVAAAMIAMVVPGRAYAVLVNKEVTGYVRTLEIFADGHFSLTMSSTLGGAAAELCTTGWKNNAEGVVGSWPQFSATADGVKAMHATLLAARLSGRQVKVQTVANPNTPCRVYVVVAQ